MKHLIVLVAGLAFARPHINGQGAITFNTHVLGSVEAPVTWSDSGKGAGTVPGLTAALFALNIDGTATLVPGSNTTFRSGAGAAYVQPVDVVLQGNTGQAVNLVMRVWSGPDYDSALTSGAAAQSAPFSVTPSAPPNAPANLTGLTGFIIVVPEPTATVIAAAGVAALLMGARRRSLRPTENAA